MLIKYEPFPQGVLSECTGHFVRLDGAHFYALKNNGNILPLCFAHFGELDLCNGAIKFFRFHEWNSEEKPHEITSIEVKDLAMIFAEPNIRT